MMVKVNFFLLLPETEPTNQWMRSTETEFSEVASYKSLIEELKGVSDSLHIEAYEGFYDHLNIKNFLCWYDTLDDCYPSPLKKILRSLLRNDFQDWREEVNQSPETNYQIFSQHIRDHTLCEIAERKKKGSDDKYALLNHHACNIHDVTIVISINGKESIEIESLEGKEKVLAWFAKNRQPARNFNINPKHGENRQNSQVIGGEKISPLRCSLEEVQTLLQTAIGTSEKEFFNLDPTHDQIIVFKYEGPTPQNMYHGYHVPKDSVEIPFAIRKRLM